MKKRWIYGMCLVASLMLTACGGNTQVAEQEREEVKVSQEDTDSKEKEEQGQEAEEEAGEEQQPEETAEEGEKKAPLRIQIETTYYDPGEDNYQYFNGYYDTVKVTSEGYDAVAQAVDDWFSNYVSNYEETAQANIDEAKSFVEQMGDEYRYAEEQSVTAGRVDSQVLSLCMSSYSYMGGAHGYSATYGLTFDSQTGEEITLENLGDIKSDLKKEIMTYLEENEDLKEGLFEDYESSIDQALEGSLSWYLSGLGMEVIFNQYDIAPYAAGAIHISVPYDKLSGFNPAYLPREAAYNLPLEMEQEYSFDLGSDGEEDIVKICAEYTDDYCCNYGVKVNGVTLNLDEYYAFSADAYFTHTNNNRDYVVLVTMSDNDYHMTILIDVTNGKPKVVDELSATAVTCIYNDSMSVVTKVDMLGSYMGTRTYGYENGTLEPVEERYEFQRNDAMRDSDYVPTVIQPVTVRLMRDGEFVEEELPEGTKIYPVNSDYESVVGFYLEDDTYGEIDVERVDYSITIDGKDQFDVFDKLPYAG